MSPATLSDFEGLVIVDESTSESAVSVRDVAVARSMADMEAAEPGTLVVVDPAFDIDAASYRFDLALRTLPDGVAAVVTYAERWTVPSITASRIARDRGIALGHLAGRVDAVSVARHLQTLLGEGGRAGLGALDFVTGEVEKAADIEAIPELLESCARHLGTTFTITDNADPPQALPLRVGGHVRRYLEFEEDGRALVKSAAAQIARRLEELYEADYEARELPEVTRSELFNEILLSDAATGADAVNRLRHSDFPIDGSHLAIRVDCHEPLPPPSTMRSVARCQARVAEILLNAMRDRIGQWTQAGTMNSILLISTLERAHSDMVSADLDRSLHRAIVDAELVFPGLRIHVGMGTPQLGAPGFRASVAEATTAVRTARARGRLNEIEQFDRLGLGRALVRWAEIDGVRPVIDEIMQPLLRQPPRQARESIATLRAYLDAGRNVTQTAEVLHLHRNTVHYRLDRITNLLSVNIDDPDDRLLLELSCRVVEAEVL